VRSIASRYLACLTGLIALCICSAVAMASNDIDADGYVGRTDFVAFDECLGGPETSPPTAECLEAFDADGDGDVDLTDYASFANELGHLPVPLKDVLGNPITAGSTEPYSPRNTCGECHESHDPDVVANGDWFQQGRTDVDGNVDMRDDYYGDGRWWTKSSGRYGKWGQSFQFILAGKENTHPSQIDQTTFMWVKECGGCHAGGGPGEYDRDGQLIYDATTGELGYEALGQSAQDVALDGDYSYMDRATGNVTLAPWNVTGLSGPDCLLCHRANRPTVNGEDMVWGWRNDTLMAGEELVDAQGKSVPAFAAASTAGQGWFAGSARAASPEGGAAAFMGSDSIGQATAPSSTTLQIDYSVGVADGSLVLDEADVISLDPSSIAYPPTDKACVGCHPLATVTGTVWFDERDVHYNKFTRHNDETTTNDVPAARATVCIECHPSQIDHNAAKGNSFQIEYRDELDYVDFRSCRDCHLADSPVRHPDAPEVPGSVIVHVTGSMMNLLSCQTCHIPYALAPGVLFRDLTIPGSVGSTSQYLSADPLNPDDPDKSKWYPALRWKEDSDGVERLFPASVWVNIYFGDWDDKNTPGNLSDDVISPIYTWRVASVVGPDPLPVVTDDDNDGRLEINRPEELLAYFDVLKGNDPNGVPVALNPVLVRGHRVWYEDPGSPDGVNAFEHEGTGIPITSYPYIWGMDHNVLAQEESWGAYVTSPAEGCPDCHRPTTFDAPVFDRLILVDPYDLGGPIYETVRQRVGLNP